MFINTIQALSKRTENTENWLYVLDDNVLRFDLIFSNLINPTKKIMVRVFNTKEFRQYYRENKALQNISSLRRGLSMLYRGIS